MCFRWKALSMIKGAVSSFKGFPTSETCMLFCYLRKNGAFTNRLGKGGWWKTEPCRVVLLGAAERLKRGCSSLAGVCHHDSSGCCHQLLMGVGYG